MFAQCHEKGMNVDTNIIGLFTAENQKIQYIPCPEYLEAGRFKLTRDIRDKMNEKGYSYPEFYNNLKSSLSKNS